MSSADRVRPDRETTDVVGARIWAQVVDLVVMFGQVVAVGVLLAVLSRPVRADALRGFAFLGMLTLPLYGGLLEGYWHGQTLGKRPLGIKVVDPQGRDPAVVMALLRNVPAVVLFSWLTSAVALASMAMTDRRQRVFDTMADTYVVRIGPNPGPTDAGRDRAGLFQR